MDGAFLESLFSISDSSIKQYPKANLFYEITKQLILTNTGPITVLVKDFINEDKIFVESEANFKITNGLSFIEPNDTIFHVFLRASLIFKEEINRTKDEDLKKALCEKYTQFLGRYLFFLYYWKRHADRLSQILVFDITNKFLKTFNQFNDSIFLRQFNDSILQKLYFPPCDHIIEAMFKVLSNKNLDKETIKNLISSQYFVDFRFLRDSGENYGSECEVLVEVGDSLIVVFNKIFSNYHKKLETNSSLSPEEKTFFENIEFILNESKNKGNQLREDFLTNAIATSTWGQGSPDTSNINTHTIFDYNNSVIFSFYVKPEVKSNFEIVAGFFPACYYGRKLTLSDCFTDSNSKGTAIYLLRNDKIINVSIDIGDNIFTILKKVSRELYNPEEREQLLKKAEVLKTKIEQVGSQYEECCSTAQELSNKIMKLPNIFKSEISPSANVFGVELGRIQEKIKKYLLTAQEFFDDFKQQKIPTASTEIEHRKLDA